MEKRDLAYTSPDQVKAGERKRQDQELPPPLIGWRFLLCAVALLASFTAIGTWKVSSVFELRDHEIEASRIQVLTQQRRDRYKALEARLSQLQGSESLRDAAVSGLGMEAPLPQSVQSVVVSQSVSQRWANASAQVREKAVTKSE